MRSRHHRAIRYFVHPVHSFYLKSWIIPFLKIAYFCYNPMQGGREICGGGETTDDAERCQENPIDDQAIRVIPICHERYSSDLAYSHAYSVHGTRDLACYGWQVYSIRIMPSLPCLHRLPLFHSIVSRPRFHRTSSRFSTIYLIFIVGWPE